MHQQEIISLIRSGRIKLAGYKKARIYGTLHCRSGKRMKTENRVFFSSEEEALNSGYRPCGHCLPEKYKLWKAKTEQNNLLS
jgi:methylphosphotriester-DNA--protein-cysteine methyltransferase